MIITSPEDAVNNMKLCTIAYKDNWLQHHRFRLVAKFLPRAYTQQKLLDFGCGNGLFMKYLINNNKYLSVTGYDPYYPNEEKLDLGNGINIFKSISSIGNKHFDIVCALEVIEHIKNDVEALIQIRKLLKPKGRLLLTVPSYQSLYSCCDAAVGHYRRYTRGSCIQLLEKAGFSLLHSTYFLSFLIPFAFTLKHYLSIRRMWRKDHVLDIPVDPVKIFSTLANMEYKLMRSTDFKIPCGTSIFVAATKEQSQS